MLHRYIHDDCESMTQGHTGEERLSWSVWSTVFESDQTAPWEEEETIHTSIGACNSIAHVFRSEGLHSNDVASICLRHGAQQGIWSTIVILICERWIAVCQIEDTLLLQEVCVLMLDVGRASDDYLGDAKEAVAGLLTSKVSSNLLTNKFLCLPTVWAYI